MFHFSPLRTKRLSIKLKELSIGDAIKLIAIPDHLHESAMTEFLSRVIEVSDPQGDHHITSPRAMTVQERSLTVAHYIAHVNEAGEPDFPLGRGHYSDYLISRDYGDYPLEVGDVGGDIWSISPLIGGAAEAIEQLQGDIEGMSGRYHWLTGCIAAQMVRPEDIAPDPVLNFSVYVDWLKDRMTVFSQYPESQFVELLALYVDGMKRISHFFLVDVDDSGVIVLPPEKREAGALSPVRFSVRSCVSEIAKQLAGKPRRFSN